MKSNKIKTAFVLASLVLVPPVFAGPVDDKDHKEHQERDLPDHAPQKQGPNQGRLITSVEPHLEFLVTKEGKVQLTFVDDDNKEVLRPGATATIICGDRTKPTRLTFEKTKTGYLSREKLPEGKNIPTILRVKPGADDKMKTIRLNLDLNDCPTCEFAEYNCTCDHSGHDEHDHKGHDHE